MRSVIIGFILTFGVSVEAYAEQVSFEPARSKVTDTSFEQKIKFPKAVLKSDADVSVVVRCDAYIKRNGKLSSNMCYEEGKEQYPFVVQINRAAKSSTFYPGMVNGVARITYFQYYVVFIKQGKKTSIEVIENSGLEVERLGVDYSSPQRYREKGSNFGTGCSLNQKARVNAFVSKEGVVSNVKVIGENITDKCTESLTRSFLKQKYIPAMVGGKPIDAFYSERIFNQMRHD